MKLWLQEFTKTKSGLLSVIFALTSIVCLVQGLLVYAGVYTVAALIGVILGNRRVQKNRFDRLYEEAYGL